MSTSHSTSERFRVRAVVQARLRSTRLPRKILEDLGGETVIGHLISRLTGIADLELTVAIPEGDQELYDWLQTQKVAIATGPEQDVLARYLNATTDLSDSDRIIRVTSDNPFPDIPALSAIPFITDPGASYWYPSHLPLGMGFEVMEAGALRRQVSYPLLNHHKEHVTTFIRENPDRFGIRAFPAGDFSGEEKIRLTLDEPDDLTMLRRLYVHFPEDQRSKFSAKEVLELYKRDPEFFSLNSHVIQKSSRSSEAGENPAGGR